MVTQADSTLSAIKNLVRHLTNSPGENTLTDSYIEQVVNDIYNTDFPYGIKIDQMRSVYTIYTIPHIDRYPVDVNYNQAFRSPFYCDGVQGAFYKDRTQFFNLWPRLMTEFSNVITGDDATLTFSFTTPGPILRNECIIGGDDSNGSSPVTIRDDGEGNLFIVTANPQTSNPSADTNPALPGMYNQNESNAGVYNPAFNVGSVNYVSGVFTLDFTGSGVTPATGQIFTARVAQYQPGRPYSLLFWNNNFYVRPVPDKIHKIEIESYMTPTQFMNTTDHPILNQWWKYLGYLAACEIQRQRNDFDSVAQLQEGAKRQEDLVLERQGCEEIGQPTYTMFNSTMKNYYSNNFWGNNY